LPGSGIKPYEAAQILAGLEISIAEIDFLKAVGLGDEFEQFQCAFAMKR
jgi:hypothetical protein